MIFGLQSLYDIVNFRGNNVGDGAKNFLIGLLQVIQSLRVNCILLCHAAVPRHRIKALCTARIALTRGVHHEIYIFRNTGYFYFLTNG